MNRRIRRWSFPAILSPMLFLAAITARQVSQERPPALPPCAGPEYRQLDFWVGDWDVFENDGVTNVAHVAVEKILDGCAVHEAYDDRTGLKGESLSIYDRSRDVWHQTWVTNRGQLLSIEGRLRDGALTMSGSYRAAGGEETLVRAVWKPDAAGVRETAVTSTDRGRTWKLWFDLLFRPRQQKARPEQGPASPAGDPWATADRQDPEGPKTPTGFLN